MKIQLTFSALAAAMLASACSTHDQRSDLVITGAPLATNTQTDTTKAPVCACAVATTGSADPNFTPFGSQLTTCLVIENRLPDNAQGTVRNNTNDFQLEDARVSYEVIGGGAGPAEQVVAATGYIKQGSTASLGVNLVPMAVASQIPAGATVRVTVIGEGRLLDGTKVRTSAFEHLVKNTGSNVVCN